MTGAPLPPRLTALVTRLLLPAALREEALGELAELFELRAQQRGDRAARHWYRRRAPAFALRLRLAHSLGGALAERPPRPAPRATEERVQGFVKDVQFAARGLRRNPGFSFVAVLTLALGIGANAAIFSVVRNVLLRPLPFPEPDRVVQLWESRADRGFSHASFTYGNFWDVRDQNRTFESVGAMNWSSLNLTGPDAPVRLSAVNVSVGFFRALGVQPVAGRVFVTGEDEPAGDTKVVILGNALWRSRFGGDRAIVGKRLTLGGESYAVVGVLPAGTPWLDEGDLYVPLVHEAKADRSSFELSVVGRLRPGVTVEAARADLGRVSGAIVATYPEAKGMGVTVGLSRDWIASDNLRLALYVLAGAVGLLLLIACVNLANLLLARATARTRESALRAAIGADRGRILALALTEAGLLGALGAAGGLALALGIVRLFRAFDPGRIPRLADVSVDGWVLAVTLGAALVTSFVAGAVPALRTPYQDLVTALREGERSVAGGRRTGRLRSVLVGIEVALSLMLLVGAGLLVRSFTSLLTVDRGFQTAQRIFFDVGMPPIANQADFYRVAAVQTEILTRLRAVPGIQQVAAVSARPLRGVGTGMGFAPADKEGPAEAPWASWRRVSEDYFAAMGVPLIAGRDFGDQDGRGRPMNVIISHSVAEKMWHGETAVGRRMILWKGQNQVTSEIVGVVGDMRDWGLAAGPSLAVYLPFHDRTSDVVNFVVHTSLAPDALRNAVRGVLDGLDRAMPLGTPRTLDSMVSESVASRRFTTLLLASLAALALLLALAGVYGVLAYTVSRRRPEIGVRMALGATSSEVLGLVLRQGMRPVVIGIIVGTAGALGLSRFLGSLLFGVTGADVTTYAGVTALLLGAAALACWLPARAAARVDVVAALREE